MITQEGKAVFFASVRNGILGPTLDEDEVQGCEAILDAMAGLRLSWCAYALATAYHETAHTMQPVKEIGGPKYFFRMYDMNGARPHVAKRLGNIMPGDGVKFAGRGYVQLTGRANYERATHKLGVNLVGNPDLAMDGAIAAKIMRQGMVEGWFTGKTLGGCLIERLATLAQFAVARKIINGSDKASMIGGYAIQFQEALELGRWLS